MRAGALRGGACTAGADVASSLPSGRSEVAVLRVLFCSPADDPVAWRAALEARVPGLELVVWPDMGAPEAVEAALVWLPPQGLLASLPNLRAILSLGAGVDALLRDPTTPDRPIARMVEPSMSFAMAEYVLAAVLRYHRDLDRYAHRQQRREWRLELPRPPQDRSIGILGSGVLGSAAAAMLVRHGFRVLGWSRSPRELPGVEVMVGADGLDALLAQADMLVCMLPLTAATERILSRDLFARVKPGVRLIHVGRGAQLVEADLLEALATGQVGGATLDVFATEPLPPDHPFWTHPQIIVTPHAASYSQAESAADAVAENLRRLRRGEPLLHVVDRARGY